MAIDLDALARQHFGFHELLLGQRAVIEHLLAGHSAAAIFPTGGGKSLCYQLPAIVLPGVTLVVSPLIALMKDQIDALRARGIPAHRLDSTLSAAEYRTVMDDVRTGRARLLYVAPERFNNERFRTALGTLKVALFAIDEAHCISEWGHNFRPDYLKLAGFARACGAERVLALTATAPPRVAADIARSFGIDQACVVRTPFYRPNLELHLTPVPATERQQLLLARLAARPRGPTLIYVSLQRTAEQVAEWLSGHGFPARAYHAGLEDELRADVQEQFLRSRDGIVVATIAFGMGVDKSDIRYVTHWNLPKSFESLAQEIGRAGRDRAAAICEVLVCPDDLAALENFAYGDTPTQAAIRALLSALFHGEEQLTLDLHALGAECDLRALVLRTLLTYLELDSLLEGGTPLYAAYRFKPLLTGKEIIESAAPEQRDFLRGIFRVAEKKRIWVHLDAQHAAEATGSPRERVVSALDALAEQGLIELEPQAVRHRYRVLHAPADKTALARDLLERMLQRERREIERIQQVVELTGLHRCQVRALGSYFGDEPGEACGHCSFCLRGPVSVPARSPATLDPSALAAATALAREHPLALGHPRQVARFLCGLNSPALTAAKLTRHPRFGSLAHAPFPDVLAALAPPVAR
jgi:ATP-dependent DNA helicase RecQ